MALCCRLSELTSLSSSVSTHSRFYVALPPFISQAFSYFQCHSISAQPLSPRSSSIRRVEGFRSASGVVSNGAVGSEHTSTRESTDQQKAHDASALEGGSRRRSGRAADGRKSEGTSSREDIRSIRLKKVESLRGEGSVPYAYSWKKTHSALELQEKYGELGNGEEVDEEEDNVSVAGRIMARRVFGKLAFLTLRDDSSSIQLYCEKERMTNDTFELLKNMLDVGDFVGATGTIKRTEKGELSVKTKNLTILTKSLLPLPDKWHGLTDVETRYRQRYLDMIMNSDVADIFRVRAKLTSEIRRHMEELGYIEIETPILQGAAGGAEARPFVTYHNSLQRDLFLRIATELHLKRMMVGGFEKVFEIGRIFRNEGISARHNPEFTSIEMYQAYADYNDMMELAEDIITRCAMAIHGQLKLQYQGTEIVLEKPWRRATMKGLVEEATGIDFLKYSDLNEAKRAALSALSASQERLDASGIVSSSSSGQLLNEIFELMVEKTLIQPTFVIDYPVEISPLSKPHRSFAGLVERFELFVCGRELANAFSELTDPLEQRARFQSQIEIHNARMLSASEEAEKKVDPDLMEKNDAYEVKLDEDFLTALEYGMPPAAGMGIGIDRLVMLITDSASIRDVIAFPVLKSH